MKTMKHLMLLLIALASFGSARSQCNVSIYPAVSGPDATFYVYSDSANNLTGACWWEFGDGDTAHATQTNHTYTVSGTYNACFHYYTANGCNGTVCDTAIINVCNFNPSIYYNLNGYDATLHLTHPQVNATYNWNVYTGGGNALSSTDADPQFTLPGYGSFLVSVYVTLQNGCVDSGFTYVHVASPCGSSFTTAATGGGTFSFYNADSLGTLSWDLGDGSTANQNHVTHGYSTNGTYIVCLTRSNGGCTSTTCDTVTVDLCNFNPDIVFSASNLTVDFGVANPIAGATYAWTFYIGGVNAGTSASTNPQVVFPSYGQVTAHVAVTLPNGCTDSTFTYFQLTQPGCLSVFQQQDMGLGQVNFFAMLDSSSQSGYTWDFGDGTTGTGMYATHTYTTSGVYATCVTYSGAQCSGTLCDTIIVDACSFYNGVYYNTNHYTAAFSTSNFTNVTYNWSFPGATPSSSTDPAPSATYPTYGIYQACLAITTQAGCSDTVCIDVYVPNPCHAQISYNQTTDTEFQFYATPQDSISSGFSYAWSFSDGGTASIADPVHSFANNGLTTVCLTVTGTGCIDTTCQSINVAPLPPPTYYVAGHVNEGSFGACSAIVYLIQDSAGYLSLVNTTQTIDSGNCNGQYIFWNVPAGGYYIKAALLPNDPNYANYLPTYFGDVLNWANATGTNMNMNLYNMDINLIAGSNPGGPGFVGGWVSQGAGLSAGTDHHQRSVGDPLPNIQINLLTDNDVPVASTHTDANGRYTFSNLALGTYKVYAEEINKVPYALNVTLTGNNPSQDNVNVTVNSNSAVTGLEDMHDIYVNAISPNPVEDKATITVSLKTNTDALLTLTDVNGRTLQSRKIELVTGTNAINVDLETQPAGIYNVSITGKAAKKVMRLVKIK